MEEHNLDQNPEIKRAIGKLFNQRNNRLKLK